MKKFVRVLIVSILAMVMVFAVGCRRGGAGGVIVPGGDTGVTEQVDTARTQLYVSNFNGGYGDDWVYALKERFEERYKDVEYETGKKGVQVLIDNAKSTGDTLAATMSGSRNEIFFGESMYYYDYVNSNIVADITDIVTESLEEFGDTGTIEDKFNDQQRDFYKTADGKYYGLPHYTGFSGIAYDIKLFEDNNFYFVANPSLDAATNPVNTFYNNGNGGLMRGTSSEVKSNGPDGTPGTYDDGLPATYDEYFTLCNYIVGGGMTPVIWTGQHQKMYTNWMLQAFAADYEGLDQMMLNFTFDGTANNIVQSIDGAGNVTKSAPVAITNNNGYELYKSAGRYYALSFFEKLLANSQYYHEKCFNTTESHLLAQEDFLLSSPEKGGGAGTIAMLYEGIWWENEARDVFALAAQRYGEEYSRTNRQLGFMPFPKATVDQVGEKLTVTDTHYSLGVINANCSELKLRIAKNFLKMAYTEESLREFTRITNTPKALSYTLTEEDKESMSYYGRSVWDVFSNADIVYPYSTEALYLNNQSNFNYSSSFVSRIGNTEYDNAVSIMRTTVSNHRTAKEFFDGIAAKNNQTEWSSSYRDWLS